LMTADVKAMSEREWRACIRASLPEIDGAWIKKNAATLQSVIKTNTMQNSEGSLSEFHSLSIDCKPGFRFDKYHLSMSGMPGRTDGVYVGAFSIFAYEGIDQHNIDFAITMGQRILGVEEFGIDGESIEVAWSGGGGQTYALDLMLQFVKEISDAFVLEQSDSAQAEAGDIGSGIADPGISDPQDTL